MSNLFYLILVLTIAFLSIAAGFRRGITGQIASLLGFGFGAVATRILSSHPFEWFKWIETYTPEPEFNEYAISLVSAASVYFIIYILFSLLSGIFRGAMSVFEVGMFNRLLGAFFSLVKNLLWLSIALNFLICFHPTSGLLRYERANDGNLVAAVMEIAPAILGCYGGEDFAHFHQLKEAKSISRNFKTPENVIILQG